jgi:signal transduction histidine kinase
MVAFSKKNVILLLVIAAIGTSLSILSYQYSSLTAKDIAEIASQEIRSNARIEAHDLSELLMHDIQSITNNLATLSDSPSVQNNMTRIIQALIDNAQVSTSALTDGYYVLDQNGQLVAWSNSNGPALERFGTLDLSSQEYFSVPNSTHAPFITTVMTSADGIPRLYVSYPIMVTNKTLNPNESNITKSFKGVIVAAVNVNSIGNSLQNELSPEIISNVGLMDKNGVFLYARNHSLIGKNYMSGEFQSAIPIEIKNWYNGILGRSLQGRPGAEDITLRDNTTTISYQPITIDGKRLWTLYIGSPHSLTSDVGLLIDQQKNFSTLAVVAIGTIAVGMAFLILSWNRRLQAAVGIRTLELRRANDSLIESNKLLASANEQLKVHDRMQNEFINVAAHELRTPIMPILGDAEYIENKFGVTNEVVQLDKETVSSIIRNAKRLDRLASDILDVTRIESKSLKLNKEEFDINEVLSECIKDSREQMVNDHGNADVEIKYIPGNILVQADKGRITQVISNLLRNAIKFTSEGSISVMASREGRDLLVSVQDTGPGIDQEVLRRLFSKFVTKSDRGTGLGLFISKSIVDAHGGKIWAENNSDGRGCTFTFSIPAYNGQT